MAIYVQGLEVVLVSEMEAGWYRYISEWRLHANGTIRPRFGFSAVQDSCVCNIHHHHPYWRFDFDIRTAGNNRVREYNDPPLVGRSNWHTKSFEIRRPRDPARKRKWRVENNVTGEGYDIIPGPPRMESPRLRLIGPIRAATFGFFVITDQSLMTELTAPPAATAA